MRASAQQAWNRHRPSGEANASIGCPAPWVSLEFDPSGWVLACCASQMYPLGRIGDERLGAIWNGPRAHALREAMSLWDFTVACGVCRWHLEHERLDPVAAVYDAYPIAAPDDPMSPHMMQFALSNRCNLACVMCNGELSSRIRTANGAPPLQSRYDDTFFADLEPMLATIKLAKFQGGEPFLSPEHHRLWAMFEQVPTPPQMLVTTNGTVWTDAVESVLDRFHVDISISVDAASADTYANVRKGDWAQLMRNIDRFSDAARLNGTRMHVSFCLMDRNWREMVPFLVWAERFHEPASINVVTDTGLAFHDLSTSDLVEARAVLHAQLAEAGQRLATNAPVMETQMRQLDAVLHERAAGIAAAPRQPIAVGNSPANSSLQPLDLFKLVSEQLDSGAAATVEGTVAPNGAETVTDIATLDDIITVERDRLMRWSNNGGVATITFAAPTVAPPEPNAGEPAIIEAVSSDLAARGIGDDLLGLSCDEVLSALARADGRPIWLLDADHLYDRTTSTGERVSVVATTFALSTTATRGTPGSIIRLVNIVASPGTARRMAATHIAIDTIYEEPPAEIGVDIRPKR